MMVRELTVRNFRRFRQASFSMDEGINVVKGPNESGKSTLVQALLAALYWKADSNRREVRESVTWGERDGFVLELRGEVDGGDFHLVKDFSARRASLDWLGREITSAAEIENHIREWSGLGSETAYRSTAGIRQDEVSEISAGRKELSESLQATVTGSEGEGSALEALDSLNKELADLKKGTRGTAKNPGPLVRIEEEIAKCEVTGDELEKAVQERIKAKRRHQEIGEERRDLAQKLEALEGLARDSIEQVDVEEDIEDFHRRYQLLESAAALISEEEELKRQERENYGSLKRILEGKREELGELELRRAGVSEGLSILKRKITSETGPRHAVWAPYMVVVGITLLLVGLAGIALTLYMLFATLVGVVMIVVALFPGGYLGFLKRGRDYSALKEQVEELEDTEKRLTQRMSAIIAETGCGSIESFTEQKLGYLELLARRKEIVDKLEALVPDGDITGVEEEARRLAGEVSMRERRLKELRGRTVDPQRLQEVLREKDKLEARMDGLKEESIRLEVYLSEEGLEEELLRAREELEYLERKRMRLHRKAKALQLALRWMESATTVTLSTAARRLESSIGEFMGRITEGRYFKIQVDEGTFDLRVWSEEKKDEVEVESLSRGTVDQLYLAARLALVDIICDDGHPPLLLDDPFVTFDSRRLQKAMEVIKDFSRDEQVIIFTCGDQYDVYADRVVELQPVS
jgi:DNA repair exonuclease SbcCD ATPase subunit